MKILFTFFLFFGCILGADSQTICTKVVIIKPVLTTENKKVLLTAAVYEIQYKDLVIKEGLWDVETKNGLPCKVWREPVIIRIPEQVEVQSAVYKDVIVQKTVRNGDVKVVETDCL
ncbi:MAG: hypothetical protein RL329_510 [Bacteroidota bacterium]